MNYSLPADPLMSHFAALQPLARDTTAPAQSGDEDGLANLLLEARIRSGDYFATLSTEFERLADLLDRHGLPEADALKHYSQELAYLDRHFNISPK